MLGTLTDTFWNLHPSIQTFVLLVLAAVAVTVLRAAWRILGPLLFLVGNVALIAWSGVRWMYWAFIGLLGRVVNSTDGTYRMVDGKRVVAKNVPLVRFSFTPGKKHVIRVPEVSLDKQLALRTRKEWNRMRNTVAPIVLKRDEWYCQWCDAHLDEENWSIDHIIPVSKGGSNELHNLQAMCRSCNSMKGTKSDSWGKFWDRVAA
jgi:5-methylcytosine-specific restriction endonuclease McrA